MKNNGFQKDHRSHTVLTVVFTIIAIAYLYPIFIVLVNSLKSNAAINLDTFAFPASDTFMGLQNYIKGMTFGNYPFYRSVEYSLMITLLSSALILICTSMAAWYISRVDSLICRVVYYLCVFSMVVPFQMVMFTLAKTADTLKLNRPWTIPIIYLGFGAGRVHVHGLRQVHPALHRGGRGHRRLQPRADLLPGRPAHDEADLHLRRRSGDHVGLERLPAAVSGAGYQ